jgi:hypothetical protein
MKKMNNVAFIIGKILQKNTEINQLQEAINDLNNQLLDKEKLKAD